MWKPSGVVTLNGVARSVEEKSWAEDLARRVAAVRTVNNNLQIQSLSDNVNMATEIQESDKQMKHEVADGPVTTRRSDQRRRVTHRGRYLFREGGGGKKVRLHTDHSTQKTGGINQGDRIEAQMNEENHALSIRSTPKTERRNEHTIGQLCTGKIQPQHQAGDLADGCK